jgi:PelA/Pel-15E family pectate lyase
MKNETSAPVIDPNLPLASARRKGTWRVKSYRCSALVAWVVCLMIGSLAHRASAGPGGRTTIVDFLSKPDDWFNTQDGKRIADNILSWQNANGGWWKNYDPSEPRPNPMPPPKLNDGAPGDTEDVWRPVSTYDNDATHSEMRVIAHAWRVTKDQRCADSFNRALHYVFESQYPNGGFPQRYPLQENYGRYITFNDDAMTEVTRLLREVSEGKEDFSFVSPDDRVKAQTAYVKAIDCILACQIKVNGKRTVWSQQHDALTLVARGGRAFELPGLCGAESSKIVLLLMEIPRPEPSVKDAVESAVAWYESSKITGKRVETITVSQFPKGRDRVLVDDSGAPPLWARFYDIETNQPFFVSRDGVKRNSMTEISNERRVGYNWYGRWGDRVFKEYAKWKQRINSEPPFNP